MRDESPFHLSKDPAEQLRLRLIECRNAAGLARASEADLLGIASPAKGKRGPASGWEKRVEAIKILPTDKQREIQNVVDALLASQGKSVA